MEWKIYVSKTYNQPYWFNHITGETTWNNPDEKKTPKIVNTEKTQRTEKTEKTEKKVTSNSSVGRKKNVMKIENGNGMSWEIEGNSDWSKEDYMEHLRSINESMRDY